MRPTADVSVQTDPVVVLNGAGAALGSFSSGLGGKAGNAQIPSWSAADDAAQAEALHTISLLGTGNSRQSEGRVSALEAELRAERASRQEVDVQLGHERGRKEAVQQQVLCLEYELDGKEAALQVAERTLERRDAELQQAQLQVRSQAQLPGGSMAFGAGAPSALGSQAGSMAFSAGPGASEDPRTRAMRSQLLERERQLELKDQHIARLLNVLRQGRGGEEDIGR